MITFCHGPGCTREATAEFFCGEACARAWHAAAEAPPAPKQRICARCQRADCPEPLAEWEAELLAGVGARMACSPPAAEPEFAAANPQVASKNPQAECGQPGWLGRLFERLFGKGAA